MRAEIGEGSIVDDMAVVGLKYKENSQPPKIGKNAVIRAWSIIYDDVVIGDNFATGHFVLIRERTKIGNGVLVGTLSIIDGYCKIGDNTRIQTGVYIPRNTLIGSNVFIGPNAVLLNDKYPLRRRNELRLEGPKIGDNVTIGGNSTLLPGIEIGEGAFIAAGSVVTKDVPAWSLAIGVPARIEPLAEKLKESNKPRV